MLWSHVLCHTKMWTGFQLGFVALPQLLDHMLTTWARSDVTGLTIFMNRGDQYTALTSVAQQLLGEALDEVSTHCEWFLSLLVPSNAWENGVRLASAIDGSSFPTCPSISEEEGRALLAHYYVLIWVLWLLPVLIVGVRSAVHVIPKQRLPLLNSDKMLFRLLFLQQVMWQKELRCLWQEHSRKI